MLARQFMPKATVQFSSIDSYNRCIASFAKGMNVLDYVNALLHFSLLPDAKALDVVELHAFLSSFIYRIRRADHCIEHSCLAYCGLLPDRSSSADKWQYEGFKGTLSPDKQQLTDALLLFKQCGLTEGKDYVERLHEFLPFSELSGCGTSIVRACVYVLTPNAFKRCLYNARTDKAKTYAKYYAVAEKACKYYSRYQRLLRVGEKPKRVRFAVPIASYLHYDIDASSSGKKDGYTQQTTIIG